MSEAFRVAMTFDAEHPDRPSCPPGVAERILDTLATERVRATFFVQSRWAMSQPALARRIGDEGHLVGNHSTFHARMTLLTDEGIHTDVREADDTIRQLTGADPRPWFRCPFGEGRDDPRVLGALEGLGYRNVHWDVEPFDWEPTTTAEEVTRRTVDASVARGDGAVVLLHTWSEPAAGGLPGTLARLADAGAAFVTIDQLEELP